jgi:hypothetical protein
LVQESEGTRFKLYDVMSSSPPVVQGVVIQDEIVYPMILDLVADMLSVQSNPISLSSGSQFV